MKILNILNEMTQADIIRVKNNLVNFMRDQGYNFIITNHAQFDRFFSRTDIQPEDIVNTLMKMFQGEKFNKVTEQFKKQHKEIEAVVTNYNTFLNILFSIDYHRSPSSGLNGMPKYNFKLMTALVRPDFKTDNMREKTERFGVRA